MKHVIYFESDCAPGAKVAHAGARNDWVVDNERGLIMAI